MTISDHATHFAGKTIVDYDVAAGISDPASQVYRISFDYNDEEASWEEKFASFLRDPRSGEVTALVIGLWAEPGDPASTALVVAALVEAREKLPLLNGIFLGDITYEESEISWIDQTDVSPLFYAYPQLEYFRVRGGNGLKLGTIRHEHLRLLAVEAGGLDRSIVHDIWQSHLPALEHLEIWTGSQWYGANTAVDDFAPLFTGNLFPNLRYLGLRDCEYVDELASLLVVSPLIERIRVLDLSLGTFSQRGAEALLACPAITKLEKLDVHHHYCPDDIVARLEALPIEVDVSEQQSKGDDAEEDRFIAVSE